MYRIHTLHRPVMDEPVCYIPPPISWPQLLSIYSPCLCVCVCVMERETPVGRRILTSETQPVRFTNDPVLLSLSLVCVWALSVSLLLLSVDRLNHAATITRPQIKSSSHTHNETRENTSRKKRKKGISKGKKKKSTHPLKSRNEKEGEERISTDEKK